MNEQEKTIDMIERERVTKTTEKYIVISILQFGVRWPFEEFIKGLCIDNNAAFVETRHFDSHIHHLFLSGYGQCILPCDIIAANVWQILSAWMKHVTTVNEMQLEMFFIFNPKTFLNIIIVYEITMNGSQRNICRFTEYACTDACQT